MGFGPLSINPPHGAARFVVPPCGTPCVLYSLSLATVINVMLIPYCNSASPSLLHINCYADGLPSHLRLRVCATQLHPSRGQRPAATNATTAASLDGVRTREFGRHTQVFPQRLRRSRSRQQCHLTCRRSCADKPPSVRSRIAKPHQRGPDRFLLSVHQRRKHLPSIQCAAPAAALSARIHRLGAPDSPPTSAIPPDIAPGHEKRSR